MKANHVDTRRKVIYLTGTVDEDMYKQLITGLTILRDSAFKISDPEKRKEYNNRTTAIGLNTYGGDVYQAFAIYDIIRDHGNIDICCIGPVMSSGIIILQAARKRFASPNSHLMIHYGEEYSNSPDASKHNNRLYKEMKSLIQKRVKVKSRTVNNWFKGETFFSAKDALRNGLIDGISND